MNPSNCTSFLPLTSVFCETGMALDRGEAQDCSEPGDHAGRVKRKPDSRWGQLLPLKLLETFAKRFQGFREGTPLCL